MAAQPNFVALGQNLANALAEIVLIPNIPPLAVHAQLNQILQQQAQMNQRLVGVDQRLVGVDQRLVGIDQHLAAMQIQLDIIQAAQNLLPMRLYNATASLRAPLQYPANIQMPPQAPQEKRQLLSLTQAHCLIVSQALQLPPLGNDPTLVQRRQQLIDYLGCAMTA